MEGVSGVATGDQTSAGGADYNRFRRLMTEEANAAIKASFEAGATEVVVNDSHGSMRNLLIEELDHPAKLISNNIFIGICARIERLKISRANSRPPLTRPHST